MENDLIKQGHELFNAKQYTEAIQKLNEALDTTNDPQQQVDVQFLLGRCYLFGAGASIQRSNLV